MEAEQRRDVEVDCGIDGGALVLLSVSGGLSPLHSKSNGKMRYLQKSQNVKIIII